MKKLKVAVITQSDIYSIPKNVFLLCDSKYIDVKCITQIDSKGSLNNKKFYFLSGFGFFQCVLLYLKSLRKRIIILFEKISFYNFNKCSSFGGYYSCIADLIMLAPFIRVILFPLRFITKLVHVFLPNSKLCPSGYIFVASLDIDNERNAQ